MATHRDIGYYTRKFGLSVALLREFALFFEEDVNADGACAHVRLADGTCAARSAMTDGSYTSSFGS